MCFTLIGRLQTRLCSLALPLGVTALFASIQHTADYWTLFALMVLVGLALDVGVYGWLIRYQPRWLTISLGVCEFFVIRFLAGRLSLFAVRLSDSEAALFYLCAWLGVWLSTQMLLPLCWPRWAESGGELG
jgi:hypothetical protein